MNQQVLILAVGSVILFAACTSERTFPPIPPEEPQNLSGKSSFGFSLNEKLDALIGKSFATPDELAQVIKARWSLSVLDTIFASIPPEKQEGYTQPPIIFLARNWEGKELVGEGQNAYSLHWVAISIDGKVEAYMVSAIKEGRGRWLEFYTSPKLHTLDRNSIRQLINEAEKKLNGFRFEVRQK